MDDDKILEFMTEISSELKDLKEGQLQNRKSIEIIAAQTELLTANFESLETKGAGLENEVKSIKEIVVRIENEQGKKINILFNGHLQNKKNRRAR